MKLYNALTKQIDEFQPINKDEVRIYSCGPTVYDRAHIGNLSAYIFADTLRRSLELEGYKVKHVMNYTDVDDKTIKRSQEKYPDLQPKEALTKLTKEYKELFLGDMKKIGVDVEKIQFVSAVDNIPAMQQLITKLVREKIAYITDDGVYFSIKAYKNSGKTYGQLLKISSESTSEARIDNDEYDKESVHDFALWKVQKAGEPGWDFEIDGKNLKGRPGWHIECSAMSEAALGLPFDIHTGGIDLIFPHHENEIAQSTAVGENTKMANYFVHNNHILVDGRKMAKSAQNFYTLDGIAQKGFDPLAFRLLVLQAHYQSEINFTWESLEAAQSRLKRWRNIAELSLQEDRAIDSGKGSPDTEEAFAEHITNNLDSPRSIAEIENYLQMLESLHFCFPCIQNIYNGLIARWLGIEILSNTDDITVTQKQLIEKREEARAAKDWQKSDEIRTKLEKEGIGVRDTDQGPIWYSL